MKLKQIAVTMAFALGTGAAAAATYNLGDLGLAPQTAVKSVSGNFVDYLNFNVVSPYRAVGFNVLDLPVSFGQFDLFNIAGLSLALYDGTGGTGNLMASLAGQDAYEFSQLLAVGDYSLKVSGTATGTSGGMYSYAAVAYAVPEPGSLAVFLTGLGLMGVVGLRRRRM